MLNPEHLKPNEREKPVILIAEDHVMILNVARITLEANGFFVLTAENGEEALSLSRQFPGDIDLLLTDVRMPKMSGAELSRHISVERPKTQIVLMSGYAEPEEIGKHYPFLQKPFGPHQLVEAVQGLLDSRRPKKKNGSSPTP